MESVEERDLWHTRCGEVIDVCSLFRGMLISGHSKYRRFDVVSHYYLGGYRGMESQNVMSNF